MSFNESKPGTVTTAQVFLWIGVAASIVLVCLLGSVIGKLDDSAPTGARSVLIGTIVVVVPFAFLSGLLAVKLGARRNWARVTTVVLYSISLALTIFTTLFGFREFGADAAISLAISLAVILCLSGNLTKEWFTSGD